MRRATLNDDDKQQQRYLETLKKRFSFAELGIKIQFVECSIAKEDLQEVYRFIEKTF